MTQNYLDKEYDKNTRKSPTYIQLVKDLEDIKVREKKIQSNIKKAKTDEMVISEFQDIMKIPKDNKEIIPVNRSYFVRTNKNEKIRPLISDYDYSEDEKKESEELVDMDWKLRNMCKKYPNQRVALVFDDLKSEQIKSIYKPNKKLNLFGVGIIDCGNLDENFHGNDFNTFDFDDKITPYVFLVTKENLMEDLYK